MTRPLFDADYAAIEARIVCWLAGQEDALDEYRQGLDRYKTMASFIFRVPYEEVNKHPQRFIGKQTILGCIAEGELVLTDFGLVPIEKVCCWHRVWDGVEWVNHDGVIYQGHKEVITHQGLTATPCHQVFIRDSMGLERTTNLRSAREQKQRLLVSGKGGAPIRTVEADKQTSLPSETIQGCQGAMRVWNSDIYRPQNLSARRKLGVRPMRAQGKTNQTCPQVVGVADASSEGPLHQSRQPSVPLVRGAWNPISIPFRYTSSPLGDGQLRLEETPRARQEGQRRTLRPRKPKICHAENTNPKPVSSKNKSALPSPGMALLRVHGEEIPNSWDGQGANTSESEAISNRETQGLENHSKKIVATYDILNAGPRHRFTVSNVLVHNCGFGMGKGGEKFVQTCWKLGRYKCELDLARLAVTAFREKHARVESYWYDVENAAQRAIAHRGEIVRVSNKRLGPYKVPVHFLYEHTNGLPFLFCKLPSGRKLAYPRPRLVPSPKFEGKLAIKFFGHIIGTQWGDVDTYGGKLVENITQAVAADIMCQGAHNAEADGFGIMALIHDQALAYKTPGQRAERFVECLTDMPAWADGLPIEAEGGEVPFYKKD